MAGQSYHTFIWHKADIEGLNKEVSDKLAKLILDPTDIEANWSTFRDILIQARDKFVPNKKSSIRHNLPWYNQRLRRLGKRKQRLYKKAKKSKNNEDIRIFKNCRSEFSKLLKAARRDYFLDFLELII